MDYFTGSSVIMKYGLVFWQDLKLKRLNDELFLSNHQVFNSQVSIDGVGCGLLVDYCDVLINCLDSHSEGTHSIAEDLLVDSSFFSKSVLMKKQTSLHLEWPEGEYICL